MKTGLPNEKPARKPRQGKHVYERIREMAISYEFLPDESINEDSLAKSLGVSRSPVRDALNRLVTDGLMNYRPNFGFFARSLTDTELYDLAEARLGIEVEALSLAFDRCKPEDAQALLGFWKVTDAALAKTDPKHTAAADEEFHRRIVKMSGNSVLLSIMETINARIRFIREIEIESPIREGADFNEHFRIAQALIDGNREAGLAAMRRHLTFTRENASAVLREGIIRVYHSRSAHNPDQVSE